MRDLQEQFGQIDIYFFDQLLRRRIRPGMKVLDAGCGYGRNLIYLIREGFEVYGADQDVHALEGARRLAGKAGHFHAEPVEAMSFPDRFADVVISSAVLHFARDDEHFGAMLRGSWRCLKPGGLFFCRLASTIGIENLVRPIAGRRCWLPDGTERYLVDEALLLSLTAEVGGTLADPLKTTVVQNQRSMTTWVVTRNADKQ